MTAPARQVDAPPPGALPPDTLRSGVLPRATPWVVGLLALAVSAAVSRAFGTGTAALLVLAAVLFLLILGGVSAAVEGRRRAVDRVAGGSVVVAFLLALAPLAGVLGYTLQRGLARFDAEFFNRSLRNIGARDVGGGAYHAILGTLEQVGMAALISVPFGLLVAVYIVEYGRGRLAQAIRFFVDVMTGIPSVVAGLFVLSFWILGLGFGYSGFAAALALTILMLPTIVRSAEEMLKLVPGSLREGALALGVPQWKVILRIVLPTARAGIVTGVMLAVARVMGETAPVLLTAFGAASINPNLFSGAQASLPLMIFQQAGDAQRTAIDRAWTAALTLILVIMVLNLVARVVTSRSTLRK